MGISRTDEGGEMDSLDQPHNWLNELTQDAKNRARRLSEITGESLSQSEKQLRPVESDEEPMGTGRQSCLGKLKKLVDACYPHHIDLVERLATDLNARALEMRKRLATLQISQIADPGVAEEIASQARARAKTLRLEGAQPR